MSVRDTKKLAWSLVSWFGLSDRLGRQPYILAGLILMPLKYLVEALVIWNFTGRFFSPMDYVNPFLSSREHFAADAPSWLGMAWVLWSLPFLWLAIVLSIRRAYDAHLSPCVAFLLLGLEGIICIAMAIPIMVPLGLFGALVGRSIAVSLHRSQRAEQRGLWGCLLLLPLIAWLEPSLQRQATFEVISQIEIEAPIENVWENVIHFSDIAAEPAWYFRMGIAYPTRARIEGRGVGAKRYCEFSTGTFVEPISAWERPYRLSFDVSDQPEPLFELTPYRSIHPPHLDGSFTSTRGEFRLSKIGPRRTLLEGSTWYQLELQPASYWTVWTDWILHRIHYRVLDHIKQCCESDVVVEPQPD